MEMKSISRHDAPDLLTVISLSLIAYILSVVLHELAGHGLACVLLGGHPAELGAFYVDCQYRQMTDLSIRLVALAGPLMSFIVGVLAYFWLSRLDGQSPYLRFLLWLFGTISLMTATGYLLFSGISGLGDFGVSRDGALYQVSPEWLWRIILTLLGAASYALVIFLSLRRVEGVIGGGGSERAAAAQKLSLTAYLTGAIMSVLVGLLNPHGLIIVLTSAVASSLGGTSGLAWMAHLLDRKKPGALPLTPLNRNWFWIGGGLAITLLYAIILGPTIRL